MTRTQLEKLYNKKHAQAGDTEHDFYEWAIGHLIEKLDLPEKTDKQIRTFVEDHYYCDEENGVRAIWQPFETWDRDDIEEQIDTDVLALKGFLK